MEQSYRHDTQKRHREKSILSALTVLLIRLSIPAMDYSITKLGDIAVPFFGKPSQVLVNAGEISDDYQSYLLLNSPKNREEEQFKVF